VVAEEGALLLPYAEIVDPHWVQFADGTPPTTPGFMLDQSMARAGLNIPDQA
jgi:hypothetical protein